MKILYVILLTALVGCGAEPPVDEPITPAGEPTPSASPKAKSETEPALEIEFAALNDFSANEGETLEFTLVAVSESDLPVTYSCAEECPENLTLDAETGVVEWLLGYDTAGEREIAFSADDTNATTNTTAKVAVTNVNRAPVLDSLDPQSVAENVLLTFDVGGTDPDGDAVAVTAGVLPTGATFVDGVFEWTPDSSDSGTVSVDFTASDGDLTDTETIQIAVNNVNQFPVLDAIGNKAVAEGAALSFTVTGSDPDGDAVTLRATGLPTGATFDGTDFDWTPGEDTARDYTVVFEATDGDLSDTESITISVSDTNWHAPHYTNNVYEVSTNDLSIVVNGGAGADADGDSFTYNYVREYACNTDNWVQSQDGQILNVTAGDSSQLGAHFFLVYLDDGRGKRNYRFVEVYWSGYGAGGFSVATHDQGDTWSTDGLCGANPVYSFD